MAMLRELSNFRDGYAGRLLSSAIALAVSYLTWYAWRFYLHPMLYPREPKQYPYWIPGHMRAFLKDANELFTQAREYYGDTREPFTITIMGEQRCVLTSGADVASIYRNSKGSTADDTLKLIFAGLGTSPQTLERMWTTPAPAWPQKPVVETLHDLYRLHLHPGAKLEALLVPLLGRLDGMLRWDRLTASPVMLVPPPMSDAARGRNATGPRVRMSLLQMCRHVMHDAATHALFGDALLNIEPRLLEHFSVFDPEVWKFCVAPHFVSRNVRHARDCIIAALARYAGLSKEQRPGAASIVLAREEALRSVGIDERQIATQMLQDYFGLNTNVYKVCFWLLAHLLYEPELLDAVRAETKLAFAQRPHSSNSSAAAAASEAVVPDYAYLQEHCPLLASVYLEVLRIDTTVIIERTVLRATQLGRYTLPPGAKLIVPFRQLHLDGAVFGNDAARFAARRFERTPALARSANLGSFGGGANMCPGRYLARREVFAFVVLLLHRFDVSLAADAAATTGDSKVGKSAGYSAGVSRAPPFPRRDMAKMTAGGTVYPVEGDDVVVVVKPRFASCAGAD